MCASIERVLLSPATEAERLWQGAQEAFGKAGDGIAYLSEAVDLGVRVVEIMVAWRLEPVREEFPTTIASLLEPSPPEVVPSRDFLNAPKSLRFIDVLDLLSNVNLSCISPKLHHGWEDRFASCRRSRVRTEKVTSFSLSEDERDALMLIGAYRNRIFLLPPPVEIITKDVLDAYPTLLALGERLFQSMPTPANQLDASEPA